jgi:hypothetical protein
MFCILHPKSRRDTRSIEVVVHQHVPVRVVHDSISYILFRFGLLYDLSHTSTMSHHEFVKELDVDYYGYTELSTVAGLGGFLCCL